MPENIYVRNKNMIPYIIHVAYPDYKRSHMSYTTDTFNGSEDALVKKIRNIFSRMIYERFSEFEHIKIETVDDLERHYFCDGYMDNPPYEARYFHNGVWKTVSLDDDLVANAFTKQKRRRS